MYDKLKLPLIALAFFTVGMFASGIFELNSRAQDAGDHGKKEQEIKALSVRRLQGHKRTVYLQEHEYALESNLEKWYEKGYRIEAVTPHPAKDGSPILILKK